MVILRRTERSTVASKGCFESNFWTCRTQRIGWVCWVYNIGWMSWKEQMGSVDMGMFWEKMTIMCWEGLGRQSKWATRNRTTKKNMEKAGGRKKIRKIYLSQVDSLKSWIKGLILIGRSCV